MSARKNIPPTLTKYLMLQKYVVFMTLDTCDRVHLHWGFCWAGRDQYGRFMWMDAAQGSVRYGDPRPELSA